MTHYRDALEVSSAETLSSPQPGIPLLAFRSANHASVTILGRAVAEASRLRHERLGLLRENTAKMVRYMSIFGWWFSLVDLGGVPQILCWVDISDSGRFVCGYSDSG